MTAKKGMNETAETYSPEGTGTVENAEPLSPDQLLMNLLEDLISDGPPEEVASEFVEEFVLKARPEAVQILAMLDAPSSTVVEILKGVLTEAFHTHIRELDSKGATFLDRVKAEVRSQMQAAATGH